MCCIPIAAYFILYWCVLLCFILRVGIVRSLNLIQIQSCLLFIKRFEIGKAFLYL
jgi:hypothetical protein